MAAPYRRLVRTSATRVFIHAPVCASDSKGRKRTRPRVDARDAVSCVRALSLRPDSANQGARRVTTARTVCLLAGRRLKERSADVLPVRQRNCSKVDYCRCPRH